MASCVLSLGELLSLDGDLRLVAPDLSGQLHRFGALEVLDPLLQRDLLSIRGLEPRRQLGVACLQFFDALLLATEHHALPPPSVPGHSGSPAPVRRSCGRLDERVTRKKGPRETLDLRQYLGLLALELGLVDVALVEERLQLDDT